MFDPGPVEFFPSQISQGNQDFAEFQLFIVFGQDLIQVQGVEQAAIAKDFP